MLVRSRSGLSGRYANGGTADKDTIAVGEDGKPWWAENSKEAYSSGIEALAKGLSNWSESRKGDRKGLAWASLSSSLRARQHLGLRTRLACPVSWVFCALVCCRCSLAWLCPTSLCGECHFSCGGWWVARLAACVLLLCLSGGFLCGTFRC